MKSFTIRIRWSGLVINISLSPTLKMVVPPSFEVEMKVLIIIFAVMLCIFNLYMLLRFAQAKSPIKYWKVDFARRNIFGDIFGTIVFILSIPAMLIWCLLFLIIYIASAIQLLGTKREYRTPPKF